MERFAEAEAQRLEDEKGQSSPEDENRFYPPFWNQSQTW
jgi:hypothetical protein